MEICLRSLANIKSVRWRYFDQKMDQETRKRLGRFERQMRVIMERIQMTKLLYRISELPIDLKVYGISPHLPYQINRVLVDFNIIPLDVLYLSIKGELKRFRKGEKTKILNDIDTLYRNGYDVGNISEIYYDIYNLNTEFLTNLRIEEIKNTLGKDNKLFKSIMYGIPFIIIRSQYRNNLSDLRYNLEFIETDWFTKKELYKVKCKISSNSDYKGYSHRWRYSMFKSPCFRLFHNYATMITYIGKIGNELKSDAKVSIHMTPEQIDEFIDNGCRFDHPAKRNIPSSFPYITLEQYMDKFSTDRLLVFLADDKNAPINMKFEKHLEKEYKKFKNGQVEFIELKPL